jgi:predicted tellurium resistance membrane protein TerC
LLLVFIGAKMLLSPVVELPVTVSLGAIVVVAAGAIAASMWRDRGGSRHEGQQHEGPRESPRKAAVRG